MFGQNDVEVLSLIVVCTFVLAVCVVLVTLFVLIFRPRKRRNHTQYTEAEFEKANSWECMSCGSPNRNCDVCPYCGKARQIDKNDSASQNRSIFEQVFGSYFTPKK